jgi:hypothetical protein
LERGQGRGIYFSPIIAGDDGARGSDQRKLDLLAKILLMDPMDMLPITAACQLSLCIIYARAILILSMGFLVPPSDFTEPEHPYDLKHIDKKCTDGAPPEGVLHDEEEDIESLNNVTNSNKTCQEIKDKIFSTFEKLNEVSINNLSDVISQSILNISTLDSASPTDPILLLDDKNSGNNNKNNSNLLIQFIKQMFEHGVTSSSPLDESGDHTSIIRSRSHLNSNRLFPSCLLYNKNNSSKNEKTKKYNFKFDNIKSISGSKLLKLLPNLESVLYPLSLGALSIEISPSTVISSLERLINYVLNCYDRSCQKGHITNINREVSNIDNIDHDCKATKLMEQKNAIQPSDENPQIIKQNNSDLIDIKRSLKVLIEECLVSLETANRISSQNSHLADIDWLHSTPLKVGDPSERGGNVGSSSGVDPSGAGSSGVDLLGKNTRGIPNLLGKGDKMVDTNANKAVMKAPFNIIWAFNTLHLLLSDKKCKLNDILRECNVENEIRIKTGNKNGIDNENPVDTHISQNILSRLFRISSVPNISLRLCSYELIAQLLFGLNTSYKGINTHQIYYSINEKKSDEKNDEKKEFNIKKNESDLMKCDDLCINNENERKMLDLYSTCLRNKTINQFLPSLQFSRYMRSIGSVLLQWSIHKKRTGLYSYDIYESIINDWEIPDEDMSNVDKLGSDDELSNHGYGGFKTTSNSKSNYSSNQIKQGKLFISQLSSGSITVGWKDIPVKISKMQKLNNDLLMIDNSNNDVTSDMNKSTDNCMQNIKKNVHSIGLYIAMRSHTGDLDKYLLLSHNLSTSSGTYRIDGLQSDTLYKVTAASGTLMQDIEKEEDDKEDEDDEENRDEKNIDISLYVTTETEKMFCISDNTSSPNLILGRTKSSQTMRNRTSKKWSTARYIFI